jgi:hypothetical protein
MRRARQCENCGTAYRPFRGTQRFCSRRCKGESQGKGGPPASTQYTYDGRLSDPLWREIHAARAEAAGAPLYRPGAAA